MISVSDERCAWKSISASASNEHVTAQGCSPASYCSHSTICKSEVAPNTPSLGGLRARRGRSTGGGSGFFGFGRGGGRDLRRLGRRLFPGRPGADGLLLGRLRGFARGALGVAPRARRRDGGAVAARRRRRARRAVFGQSSLQRLKRRAGEASRRGRIRRRGSGARVRDSLRGGRVVSVRRAAADVPHALPAVVRLAVGLDGSFERQGKGGDGLVSLAPPDDGAVRLEMGGGGDVAVGGGERVLAGYDDAIVDQVRECHRRLLILRGKSAGRLGRGLGTLRLRSLHGRIRTTTFRGRAKRRVRHPQRVRVFLLLRGERARQSLVVSGVVAHGAQSETRTHKRVPPPRDEDCFGRGVR